MGVHFKENEEKLTLGMIITGIIAIGILVATLIVYLLNSNNSNIGAEEIIEEKQIGQTQETNDDDFETVSIDIGKTINEAKNELNTNITSSEKNTNTTETKQKTNTTNTKKSDTAETKSNNTSKNSSEEKKLEEVKFSAPIKGEIIKEFACDSLVYSQTLEEWVTHNGIDIKADKTSVVTAAAKGTVYAIKSDPRYGLTVIVNHEGGYQTIYSNLLTAEYVVEGEQIEAGQTIGTVGNTATFEISDDYHLHFELIKDNEYVNPTNYMNF